MLDILALYDLCGEFIRITTELGKEADRVKVALLRTEREAVKLAIQRLIDNTKRSGI